MIDLTQCDMKGLVGVKASRPNPSVRCGYRTVFSAQLFGLI